MVLAEGSTCAPEEKETLSSATLLVNTTRNDTLNRVYLQAETHKTLLLIHLGIAGQSPSKNRTHARSVLMRSSMFTFGGRSSSTATAGVLESEEGAAKFLKTCFIPRKINEDTKRSLWAGLKI